MKTMKTFRLFCMAALAIVMAACSNNDDEIQQPAQQQGMIPFSATIAAPNSGATTRTTYTESGTSINVAWKNGDQIALIHNGVKDVVTVGDPNLDGSAPISGSITAPASDEEDVVLVYPAASVEASGGTGITPVVAYLTKGLTQDGTLDYISNYLDSRRGSGKIISDGGSGGTLKENVKMASQIAIWKLSLQDNAATPNALSAIAVTVNVGSTTVAAAAAAAKSDYYLCLVPATMGSGDLTIDATVGSDTYTYTKAGGVSLETSKYYQSTVTMTKQLTYPITLSAATSDYVGSVVTTDGNVYATVATASAASKTAVAVIAYVGSAGSVDASSGTYKGLAVALSDANSGNDCQWAESFEDFEDCLSSSQTSDIVAALGFKNGITCTSTLTGDGHTHAATTAAESNNGITAPSGTSGWFMPSMGQWNLIVQGLATKKAGSAVTTDLTYQTNNPTYKADNLNSVITAAGGTGFQKNSYWASTEQNFVRAWAIYFTDGYATNYAKTVNSYVRSVIAF